MHNEPTNKTPEQIIADGDFIAELFEEQARTPYYCPSCTWHGLGSELTREGCPKCDEPNVRRYLGLDSVPDDVNGEHHAARVADRCNDIAPEFNAAAVNTGGGVYCVSLTLADGRSALWGTANDTWGCTLLDAEGEYANDDRDSDLPVTERSTVLVAQTIVALTRTLNAPAPLPLSSPEHEAHMRVNRALRPAECSVCVTIASIKF